MTLEEIAAEILSEEIDQKCGLLWSAEFSPLLGGDLNPILGFCFPVFSRVLPWGISIRVEIFGK